MIGREQETPEGDRLQQSMAAGILKYMGGRENVVTCENCITRLRLKLKDTSLADEAQLKRLGAHGVIIIDRHHIQIVIGTDAGTVKRLAELDRRICSGLKLKLLLRNLRSIVRFLNK